jgi:hypothetical protein
MARWSGWGAGPAGAGSTGGPSRIFLVGMLVGCVVVTAMFVKDGHLAGAAISGLAAVYFALRAFAGLGRQ